MKSITRQAKARQSGQGMLEYILLVVFVVLVGVAVWRRFGQNVRDLVEQANGSLTGIIEEAQRTASSQNGASGSGTGSGLSEEAP